MVVPTGASAAKVSALQQFDVRLVLHGEGYREAETHALELADREAAATCRPTTTPTSSWDRPPGRELAEQVPYLGTVVVPAAAGGCWPA